MAVHFWATWCVPCRAELPQVNTLADTLNGPNFEVVPISVDRDGIEVVNAFYSEQGITKLPAYLDRGLKAFRAFRLAGVPATIFIDGEGNEIARVLGDRDWARPEVLAVVRKLIAGG
jgi:thiol-disulfide isomerase/thioredoxin